MALKTIDRFQTIISFHALENEHVTTWLSIEFVYLDSIHFGQ